MLHLDAVMRILIFLKKSPGQGLVFKKNSHLNIEEYLNVDWDGSLIDIRSITGFCTSIGGNHVTYKSKK